MTNDISDATNDKLRRLLQQSREMLQSLAPTLQDRPDMQNAVRRLMSRDDLLETFSEFAVKVPDLA